MRFVRIAICVEVIDMSIDIEDMRFELAEYYECAGFKDIYERVLKHKSDNEISEMYKTEFGKDTV